MHDDAPERPEAAFRLAAVPGVNPAKWLRVWHERLPDVPVTLVTLTAAQAHEAVVAGRVDAALLRLPVDAGLLSAIPLYTETTVVVVPTDHLAVAADEVTAADLADDVLLVPADDVLGWADPPGEPSALPTPPTTAEAVELVAAGTGVLVVPQSLARLHHRRDLTYRPVTDAPTSSVALAWLTDGAPELVEELIGIVRGRTANSSRGRGTGAPGSGREPAPTGRAPAPGDRRDDAPRTQGGRPGAARPGAGRGSGGAGARGVPGRGGGPGGTRGRGGPGGRGGSGRGRGTGRSR